jgi:hypothetical protein
MAQENIGVIQQLDFAEGTEIALKGARGVALLASDVRRGWVYDRVDAAPDRGLARGTDTVAPFVDILARGPLELALDDDRVYARVDGAIGAWDDSGLLYDTPSRAKNLVADESFLYWRSEDADMPAFVRSRKGALAAIELSAAPEGGLVLATDETSGHLYWTDDTGSLFRAPKVGGSAELHASTGNFDDDDYRALLALDETSAYWLGRRLGDARSRR